MVQVQTGSGRWAAGFDPASVEILEATFEEFGWSWKDVTTYSLCFFGVSTAPRAATARVLNEELGEHDIILALGSDAVRALCDTKKTLTEYAGSLTWNESLTSWVLPSFHPNVVVAGKYDEYDILFDHIKRSVDMLNGVLAFPERDFELDFEFIGHNGERQDDNIWSGYFEYTDEEFWLQRQILTTWLTRLNQNEIITFGLDTESYTTDFFRPLTMIQVYDGKKAYAFNWGVIKQYKKSWKWFLEHENARFVLHNTKHDRKMLRHWLDVDLGDRDIDTMCYALGLTEKGKQTGLKYLSRQYCNAPFYEEDLDVWLDRSDNGANINYGHIKPEVLAKYGCLDVYYTLQLSRILPPLVEREGTEVLVRETLLPAQRTFADVEYRGIAIDVEFAKQTSAEWGPRIDNAVKEMQDYARSVGFPRIPDITGGQSYRTVCECVPVRLRYHLDGLRCTSYAKSLREDHGFGVSCSRCSNKRYVIVQNTDLNISSPKQLQHLCFDVLGMEESHKGRSCAKEFWALNASHPFAKLMKTYKELYYIRRDFLDGVQNFVGNDGNIHPDFLLFGTKTGRLAIHKPAMQTVPQHGPNAKVAKSVFLSDDPDSLIVNVDYKALEMYMAHHLTGDQTLLDNLTGEWDVHTALAAKVYDKAPEEVEPKERQSVKSVNFGAGYGIGGKKLAKDPAMAEATGGDPEVAQEFIDTFWNMYSVWSSQCDTWRHQALTACRLRTEMGRVRRWNLVTPDNEWQVRNQAINFPGQSMASDLCLRSLITLNKALTEKGWGRVLLTVHDSLVFQIKKSRMHRAVRLIESVMTTPPFETKTPFAVDIEVGRSYGEKEPYSRERDYVDM